MSKVSKHKNKRFKHNFAKIADDAAAYKSWEKTYVSITCLEILSVR